MTTHNVRLASVEYAAPCLESGPLSAAASTLVAAADAIGSGPGVTTWKARAVSRLFEGMEKAFAAPGDPLPALLDVFEAATLQLAHARLADALVPLLRPTARDDGDVTAITGEHYGRLFREFSPMSYFDEPSSLLRVRLQRNDVDSRRWSRQLVLDAGCGGGRYSVAWRMLGARQVIGVDVSASGLADARRRVEAAHINGVRFDRGDVLALPYEANHFGVVFSNGVLHHSINWRAGVAELVRVLAPAGLGWLYVIEKPGGYFWDVIEILRVIMRNEDRDATRAALEADLIPANRIFYMLDHVMVPVNLRLTPAEVEEALRESGAIEVRRLHRGADFDRVEALHRGDPYASDKYGVGENRYVFTKA